MSVSTALHVLGLPPNPEQQDIMRAFRARALENHPDKRPDQNQAHKDTCKIIEAKDVLLNNASQLDRERARQSERKAKETRQRPKPTSRSQTWQADPSPPRARAESQKEHYQKEHSQKEDSQKRHSQKQRSQTAEDINKWAEQCRQRVMTPKLIDRLIDDLKSEVRFSAPTDSEKESFNQDDPRSFEIVDPEPPKISSGHQAELHREYQNFDFQYGANWAIKKLQRCQRMVAVMELVMLKYSTFDWMKSEHLSEWQSYQESTEQRVAECFLLVMEYLKANHREPGKSDDWFSTDDFEWFRKALDKEKTRAGDLDVEITRLYDRTLRLSDKISDLHIRPSDRRYEVEKWLKHVRAF